MQGILQQASMEEIKEQISQADPGDKNIRGLAGLVNAYEQNKKKIDALIKFLKEGARIVEGIGKDNLMAS